MARYRKIEVAVWTDERFRDLSAAQPNGQTLWLYLLCGTRTTALPGLVIAGELVMAADLGWPVEGFRKAFQEAFSKGMAKACWRGGLVVLPKALFDSTGEPRETARPQSPNVIKHWAKAWDEVPECELKYEYLRMLERFTEALGEAFLKAFREAFRKAFLKAPPVPSRNQDTGDRRQDSGLRMQDTGAVGSGRDYAATPPIADAPAAEPSAPAKKGKKPKTDPEDRKRKLPDGWTPERSEANLAAEKAARERGIDLKLELSKLRDWAKGGNQKKSDWEATWRNWTRNAKPTNGSGVRRAPGDVFTYLENKIEQLEMKEKQGD